MSSSLSNTEVYAICKSTPHVPNSILPVLVYRSVLPLQPTPDSTCATIEPNGWISGGVYKHYPTLSFHSLTHECYAVFKGHSKILLGRGPLDVIDEDDTMVDLRERDIIVIPAGVAHCSLESSSNYEYVALFPKGSPRWDNNWGKAGAEETNQKAANAKAVPVPELDPIFGADGPLVKIWKQAVVKNGT